MIPNKPSSSEPNSNKTCLIAWVLGLCIANFLAGLFLFLTTPSIADLMRHLTPSLVVLNILPIVLLVFFFWFFSGRMLFSCTLSACIGLILLFVHLQKITLRQEPLLPSDFTLAKEALHIAKTFPISTWIALVVVGLLLVVLLWLSWRYSKNVLPKLHTRYLGIWAIVFFAIFANTWLYEDEARYDSYEISGNPLFLSNHFASKGFVYSFLYQLNALFQTETQSTLWTDYFTTLYATQPLPNDNQDAPHIIMIMGEAFSDMSENDALDFSNHRDPLLEFKDMADDVNAVSGKLVVSSFGGGTANSEYDVLTGLSSQMTGKPQSSSAYDMIQQDMDALPYRLQQIGYDTLAIHPGNEWFYNRSEVYEYLGFSDSYFLEDSFDLESQGIGGYINEVATMDKIIETFESHIASSNDPLFSFTVTIQNHGPYESRFGPIEPQFEAEVALSEYEFDLLNQYFKGISDADAQLGRLRDYAEQSEEPIVVVYFGDHLPSFTNGDDFFSLLDYGIDANGSLEEQLALFSTPYLIWQNDAAAQLQSIALTKQNLTPSSHLSAHYLSPMLLELLKLEVASPLYNFSNELRNELPVTSKTAYMLADGLVCDSLTQAQEEALAQLEAWQTFSLLHPPLL